jgi:mutator protein MutT
MKKNKTYSVIVNVLVYKGNKILLSQRSLEEEHEPGKWTIPGGKIENDDSTDEIFNIVEDTIKREVMEEVGVEINDEVILISNNTFRRSNGQMVLALIFLAKYKSGEPQPLEDTINVEWVDSNELDNFEFPPNVREYIVKGFNKLT